MKRVLITATVVRKHIMEFHIPYLKWFKDHGYETFVAASNDYDNKADCVIPYCDHYLDVPFSRNPISKTNIHAYKELKRLINDNKFTLIHTHTPVGGVITRLAAKQARKNGTKVIYTAHGFHFFKGAPLINWILYYPIEKYCSKFTDALLTINNEDYDLAKSKFHAKNTYLVHGVGVNFDGRNNCATDIRKELGIEQNDFVLCSVGELNKNKNHRIVLEALLKEPLNEVKNIKYILVGDGELLDFYREYVEQHGLQNKVFILGYRKDVIGILIASNLFVFPSLREGLPVSLMEAMYCGLPCIVNDIRGCRDLIQDGVGGYVCNNSVEQYTQRIFKLSNQNKLNGEFGNTNKINAEQYLLSNVIKEYESIYQRTI